MKVPIDLDLLSNLTLSIWQCCQLTDSLAKVFVILFWKQIGFDFFPLIWSVQKSYATRGNLV